MYLSIFLYEKEASDMKFKKVIFRLFLFMGALLVVFSTAYASSSHDVKFVEDGGLIYLDDTTVKSILQHTK